MDFLRDEAGFSLRHMSGCYNASYCMDWQVKAVKVQREASSVAVMLQIHDIKATESGVELVWCMRI